MISARYVRVLLYHMFTVFKVFPNIELVCCQPFHSRYCNTVLDMIGLPRLTLMSYLNYNGESAGKMIGANQDWNKQLVVKSACGGDYVTSIMIIFLLKS